VSSFNCCAANSNLASVYVVLITVPPLLTGEVAVFVTYSNSAFVICHGFCFSGVIIGCRAALPHWTRTFVVHPAATSSLSSLLLAVPPLFNSEGVFVDCKHHQRPVFCQLAG
jgi:hypothetical protein